MLFMGASTIRRRKHAAGFLKRARAPTCTGPTRYAAVTPLCIRLTHAGKYTCRMGPQAGPPLAGQRLPKPPARDAANEYRRLVATLAAKARWLGSRDPEGAAQETLARSVANSASHGAIEYYFSENPPDGLTIPDWPLDHLMAWLHAVLRYVVREERSRASFLREAPACDGHQDPADPAAGPLEAMIEQELRAIVVDCFPKLEREQRRVLIMRVDGLKYGEIASRLGVKENTVATWVSRGIRELGAPGSEAHGGGAMSGRIDGYVLGDLTPEEARALAQESLDSPELFDELTGAALAKAALDPETVRAARVIRFRRKMAVIGGGMAAAAAFILISLPRHPAMQRPMRSRCWNRQRMGTSLCFSQTDCMRKTRRCFAGARLRAARRKWWGRSFPLKRAARTLVWARWTGCRKAQSCRYFVEPRPSGRLQVTTVFRDRSRASVIEGKELRAKDEVHVAGADHLNALLQQVDAAFNRGDRDTAISLAQEAVRWGESADVPPGAMAVSCNKLAVLHMLRGENSDAESLLARAASAVSKPDPVYSRVQNNLGVLAELRGDRDKAASAYREALGANSGEERQIVERNLARVRGAR